MKECATRDGPSSQEEFVPSEERATRDVLSSQEKLVPLEKRSTSDSSLFQEELVRLEELASRDELTSQEKLVHLEEHATRDTSQSRKNLATQVDRAPQDEIYEAYKPQSSEESHYPYRATRLTHQHSEMQSPDAFHSKSLASSSVLSPSSSHSHSHDAYAARWPVQSSIPLSSWTLSQDAFAASQQGPSYRTSDSYQLWLKSFNESRTEHDTLDGLTHLNDVKDESLLQDENPTNSTSVCSVSVHARFGVEHSFDLSSLSFNLGRTSIESMFTNSQFGGYALIGQLQPQLGQWHQSM
jgi:hypothetical protein